MNTSLPVVNLSITVGVLLDVNARSRKSDRSTGRATDRFECKHVGLLIRFLHLLQITKMVGLITGILAKCRGRVTHLSKRGLYKANIPFHTWNRPILARSRVRAGRHTVPFPRPSLPTTKFFEVHCSVGLDFKRRRLLAPTAHYGSPLSHYGRSYV